MLSVEEAKTRVARGAAYLDRQWPEWAQHVEVNELDMRCTCNCVIGQLKGDYNKGIVDMFGGPRLMRNFWRTDRSGAVQAGIDLGFDVPDWKFEAERDADFARLQDAWITEIAHRRLWTKTPKATAAVTASVSV